MKDLVKAFLLIAFSVALLAYDHYAYEESKREKETLNQQKQNKNVQLVDSVKTNFQISLYENRSIVRSESQFKNESRSRMSE